MIINSDIKTVTVIGATGNMGMKVAAIFASFGNAKVFCVGRDKNKVSSLIPDIASSVRADTIKEHLIPCSFDKLEECVNESDLIFESCSENIEIKKQIAHNVASFMSSNAISCTGTSGMSIDELAAEYPDNLRERFFGVHFFNPPYNMPLCELVSSKYSDINIAKKLSSYLQNVLFRKVIEVEDSPAFLANRIGFQFINNSMILANKYKGMGGIDYIDAVLGRFTGRNLAPLATANFVGLDIHQAICDNIYNNTNDYMHESFVLPDFVSDLINKEKLGVKVGEGLYRQKNMENCNKVYEVYDINTHKYRQVCTFDIPIVNVLCDRIHNGQYKHAICDLVENKSVEAEIILDCLAKYIEYSWFCAKSISEHVLYADDAMAFGFNWCPPFALLNLFNDSGLVKAVFDRFVFMENQDEIKQFINKSSHQYEKYLKSNL